MSGVKTIQISSIVGISVMLAIFTYMPFASGSYYGIPRCSDVSLEGGFNANTILSLPSILFGNVASVVQGGGLGACCTDTCQLSDPGDNICQDNRLLQCGDFDTDQCFEYQTFANAPICQFGCFDGVCYQSSPCAEGDSCNLGQTKCTTTGGQPVQYKTVQCQFDNNLGCYKWNPDAPLEICKNGCDAGGVRCLSDSEAKTSVCTLGQWKCVDSYQKAPCVTDPTTGSNVITNDPSKFYTCQNGCDLVTNTCKDQSGNPNLDCIVPSHRCNLNNPDYTQYCSGGKWVGGLTNDLYCDYGCEPATGICRPDSDSLAKLKDITCTQGSTRCTQGGKAYAVCNQYIPETGTYTWGTEYSCGIQNVCTNGACTQKTQGGYFIPLPGADNITSGINTFDSSIWPNVTAFTVSDKYVYLYGMNSTTGKGLYVFTKDGIFIKFINITFTNSKHPDTFFSGIAYDDSDGTLWAVWTMPFYHELTIPPLDNYCSAFWTTTFCGDSSKARGFVIDNLDINGHVLKEAGRGGYAVGVDPLGNWSISGIGVDNSSLYVIITQNVTDNSVYRFPKLTGGNPSINPSTFSRICMTGNISDCWFYHSQLTLYNNRTYVLKDKANTLLINDTINSDFQIEIYGTNGFYYGNINLTKGFNYKGIAIRDGYIWLLRTISSRSSTGVWRYEQVGIEKIPLFAQCTNECFEFSSKCGGTGNNYKVNCVKTIEGCWQWYQSDVLTDTSYLLSGQTNPNLVACPDGCEEKWVNHKLTQAFCASEDICRDKCSPGQTVCDETGNYVKTCALRSPSNSKNNITCYSYGNPPDYIRCSGSCVNGQCLQGENQCVFNSTKCILLTNKTVIGNIDFDSGYYIQRCINSTKYPGISVWDTVPGNWTPCLYGCNTTIVYDGLIPTNRTISVCYTANDTQSGLRQFGPIKNSITEIGIWLGILFSDEPSRYIFSAFLIFIFLAISTLAADWKLGVFVGSAWAIALSALTWLPFELIFFPIVIIIGLFIFVKVTGQ